MPQMIGRKPLGSLRGLAAYPRRPLLSPDFRVVAGTVAGLSAAVTAFLGAEVTHQTRAGWLDSAVDGRLRADLGGHPAVLAALAGLGDPISVTVLATASVLACLATRRVRGALIMAVAVPVSGAIELLLKSLIDRTHFGSLSYPSGHTTGVFALAVAISVLLIGPLRPHLPIVARVLLALTGLAVACAVAVSLVVLGKHYFTDTVGGAAVAMSTVLVTALVIDGLADRRKQAARAETGGRPVSE